jgi:dihydrofolate reductase
MIHAIFAVDKFGGMGLNGTLPWPHHAEDLSYFQHQTAGHIVVMGRNTWDDPKMPKPLPGREVYVATNKPIQHPNTIKGDLKSALLELERANPNKIIWVVGGPAILEQCADVLDKIHLTHHKSSYKVDSKIDLKSFLSGWMPHTATSAPTTNCSFVTYVPMFKRKSSSDMDHV